MHAPWSVCKIFQIMSLVREALSLHGQGRLTVWLVLFCPTAACLMLSYLTYNGLLVSLYTET